ncbi:hypothetical protein BCR44DRAFT_90303 [Catenaria anguillulae PL171]|uniref:Ankyrin repeat-containing domain protein n=1 Tax=Catenaria anguillulae PL171 TaxID=765915 RepID=A0A1Y2H870_9FUNG|nr:hypothetical protein BCR44DRAFT_90303 [Catenaria anguillulae PL171]
MTRPKASPSSPLATLAARSPSMLHELAEPILALAIHLVARSSLWHPLAIVRPLNVISRKHAPLLTQVALSQLPRIDMITATRAGDADLLNLMVQWSNRPRGRPLRYKSSDVVQAAMRSGNIQVIEWWQARHMVDYFFVWPRDAISEAVRCGHVHVLDWWQNRGMPGFRPSTFVQEFVGVASAAGHVQVLDWLLKHVNATVLKAGESEALWPFDQAFGRVDGPAHCDVMGQAAQFGHVDVLEWWMCKSSQALVARPTLHSVFRVAVWKKHLDVLEWCKMYPNTVEQRHTGGNSFKSIGEWTITLVQHGMIGWVDTLSIELNDHERQSLCDNAYASMRALRWTLERGWIGGEPALTCLELAIRTAGDFSLELLEWLHTKLDEVLIDSHAMKQVDLCLAAVKGGHVEVLDWLVAHGHALQEHNIDEYFVEASHFGHARLLDQILKHAPFSNPDHELLRIVLTRQVMDVATVKGSISVLEWWATQIQSLISQFDPFKTLYKDMPDFMRMQFQLQDALGIASVNGHADVVEWWLLRASRPAQALGKWFPTRGGMVKEIVAKVCGSSDVQTEEQRMRILTAWGWHDMVDMGTREGRCGQAVEFIHNKLIGQASSRSLLWYWANVPLTRGMPNNGGSDYVDPVDVYILEHMLKVPNAIRSKSNSSKFIRKLSREGHVATLQYLKRQGILTVQHLSIASEEALVAATRANRIEVLEWWRRASGVAVRFPCDKASWGDVYALREVMDWWIESGLYQEVELEEDDEPL